MTLEFRVPFRNHPNQGKKKGPQQICCGRKLSLHTCLHGKKRPRGLLPMQPLGCERQGSVEH